MPTIRIRPLAVAALVAALVSPSPIAHAASVPPVVAEPVPPAVASAAPSAATSAEGGWSAVPADAEGPDGRLSLRHVVDPGASVSDAIAVTNHGGAEAVFDVAAGDGVIGEGGAFDIAAEEPVDAGAWIALEGLDDGALTIPAGETRVVPLTISVPADATPGDHPAGVVVGVSSEAGGATVTHRVGVRLHLQVAGDIVAGLEIGSSEVSFEPSPIPFAPGTVTVDYEVRNAGNIRLGAVARTEASGPFGLLAAETATSPAELLPGDTATATTTFSAWPLFVLFSDTEIVATALGEDVVDLPDAVRASALVPAVSWTGVAALVLLAGVVVLLVRRRRRRRRRRDARTA